MKTPPDSSIAKLLAIVSPAGSRTERTALPGVTKPTTPDCVTNQIRPAQSGSALWMPEPPVTPLRSTSRTTSKPLSSSVQRQRSRWPVNVETTARSWWSR